MKKTKTKKQISRSLKHYYKRQKTFADCKALTGFIIIIATVAILIKLGTPAILSAPSARIMFLPENKDKEILTIQDKITIAAQENNINVDEALAISFCESGHNPLAKNSNSSASGLFQFINSTWENYCHGDVFNADYNIACFVKLYPTHKSWWKCAKILGYTN